MGAPGISCYTPLVASCSTGGLVGIGFCVSDLLNVSVASSCSLPLFLSLSCLPSLSVPPIHDLRSFLCSHGVLNAFCYS